MSKKSSYFWRQNINALQLDSSEEWQASQEMAAYYSSAVLWLVFLRWSGI